MFFYRVNVIAGSILLALLMACSDGSDRNSAVENGTDPAGVESADDTDSAEVCRLPGDEVAVSATSFNVEFVRTPDACFTDLDGYDYPPHYLEIDGLRMHYVDQGSADGELVLLLHGEPSWSYLYRKMIPVLVDAGYRVIALDHIGMGRSDKPTDPRVHQYEQHVLWVKAFIQQLELRDITLFVQDWGSLIGLRVAGDMPELFGRIIIANGDMPIIPQGANPFTVPTFEIDDSLGDAADFFANRTGNRFEQFQQWIDYAASVPELLSADVVELGTRTTLNDAQRAAYDAPYPSFIYKAAIRAFPSMVAGIEEQNTPAWNALGEYEKPFLALAGEDDPNLGSVQTQNKWIAHVPGAAGQDHKRFAAAHFIQEDVGAELAAHVVKFMQENPLTITPVSGFLYNFRYCEVLLISLEGDQNRADVYNSGGLNDCPQEQWEELDALAIASAHGAATALLNGPRFFVLDWIINNGIAQDEDIEQPVETFGQIEMRLAASVLVPSGNIGDGGAVYRVSNVSRNTVFQYVAGRRVYELQDLDGQRYMMQSFSRAVDEDLQLSELATLGDRLELPQRWSFRTHVLAALFDLPTVNDIADVVTDDLLNTYQRIP